MPDTIQTIIHNYVAHLREIFGSSLIKVIVYGSYARGTYDEHSDIDVMILVSSEEKEIRNKFNDVCDIAFDFEMDYGIVISPVIKNERHFLEWSEILPFYRNVSREGVLING